MRSTNRYFSEQFILSARWPLRGRDQSRLVAWPLTIRSVAEEYCDRCSALSLKTAPGFAIDANFSEFTYAERSSLRVRLVDGYKSQGRVFAWQWPIAPFGQPVQQSSALQMAL
ncbi:unnamed protein product [Prorocentrum cordatum]|uniref:Uncharacterized protein n=1 Tax=Prorocentrum cordatum TaxID=2364126 RepID=A0ABN9SFT0_9DINO|nr:unnamed protein product [Polarella glacialis]